MAIVAKKVPFYGMIFGFIFAANRLARNRNSVKVWILSSLEITSGVISVIPYIGV